MLDVTKPNCPLGDYQRVRTVPAPKQTRPILLRRSATRFWFLCFILFTLIYFLAPIRTNLLLLGTDDSADRGGVGRTDTIILTTVVPLAPYVGMLSIPRDLWVTIPGVGEQRINTAYFFAESSTPGTGPEAAMQTVHENFGVPVQYYAVVHMQGLVAAIDGLGGVDIRLEESMGGLPAGSHHLNGTEALMFVRDRSTGDDFGRMTRAQILIASLTAKALQPTSWSALPRMIYSLLTLIETNIPFWQWPRLSVALVRSLFTGVDGQAITREMVTPFQTSAGAQVLSPNWDLINPLLRDMFGG
jgi:polyisoprenyl-teichoic acid--peptidoglycan teichoic acid transferase